jgi:hypothetical protein
MTDADIVKAYDRIEEQCGGIANISPIYVVDRTAQELGVSVERVRRVMIDHWTMRGGG